MNKNYFIAVIIGVILVFGFIFFYQNNYESQENIEKSSEYHIALNLIKEGNSYVLEIDRSDNCFPYRYYNRGCYYMGGEDNMLFDGDLGYFGLNLSSQDKIELCYNFAHKGAIAYCLYKESGKEECLDFARDNEYLIRICELDIEYGETIPYGDPGPKDVGEDILLITYSELE